MIEGYSGNTGKQPRYVLPICFALAALAVPAVSFARDVKIGGGIRSGYEFDDRKYDKNASADEEQQKIFETSTGNIDERYSRIRLAPLMTLSSSSARDEVSLRYTPAFRYDFENSDNDVDHDLSASLNRFLSRDWQMKLTDSYLRKDSVENPDTANTYNAAGISGTDARNATETDSMVNLSDNRNRRKYWTNNLSLKSEYTYWQESLFSLGYSYNILRNVDSPQDSNYEDFDRHEVSSSVAHRFDSVWRLTLSGSYVRGLYDENVEDQPSIADTTAAVAGEGNSADEKDLNEYRAATTLESNLFDHQTQKLSYSFYGVDYDAPKRDNSVIHDMTLGWQWDISKELMFGVGAGPSYSKTEGADGEWGYNGNLSCRYAFERGSIGLTANRGFERQNFTGTDENGLREFWQSKLSINSILLENLSTTLYSSYRYEDEEEITEVTPAAADQQAAADNSDFTTTTGTFNRKRFSTGASLGYTFWQWYQVALSYDYTNQDSEKLDDSFNEHKVALTLSYEKELFQW